MPNNNNSDTGRRRFVRDVLVAGGMIAGAGVLTGGLANKAQAQGTTTTTASPTTTVPPAAAVPVMGAAALATLTVAVGATAAAKLKKNSTPG